jgi:hypothetical protein
MTVQRLSKRAAADTLGISLSTLHRRIQRGELETEREGSAANDKVWVLVDIADDSPDDIPSDIAEEQAAMAVDILPVPSGMADDREVAVLREQVKHLEELAAYRAELLKESELRFHELMASSQKTIEALTRALPEPPPPRERKKRTWWWPFRGDMG